MTKVVLVIPTYNEKDNILPVTRELAKVFKTLPAYNLHILFVDDLSPDGTSQVINQVIKKYPFVHLLSNKRKGGLGHAYKKGFTYAIDKFNADILFEFDADLSHDPSKIPAMLAALKNGSDLVLGSRYMAGGSIPAHWPPHRKFLSIVGNLFIRMIMLNFSIRDWTTGYRGIKKSVVQKILPNLNDSAFNGYTYQIGFLVKSIQNGYRVAEVPFHFQDRQTGYSKLGPEYIINTLRYIMQVRISEIMSSRIFKFLAVGGLGTVVQFAAFYFYRRAIPYQLAVFLSIETAVVSNFIFSNLWTFADRKLKAAQIPAKFIQFNLASGGSIVIQQAVAFLGETFIGLYALFTLPFVHFSIDTGTMYIVVGIIIGMFWNYFAYSRLVWRKK